MVIDFADLKEIVNRLVIDHFDHHYLNEIIARPTAENMTRWSVERLQCCFGDSLLRVRIYETPTSFAEWKKEKE
jgi:6-pyruvoyltetrahydropterin/6-carboxytetrahydropterin synthase